MPPDPWSGAAGNLELYLCANLIDSLFGDATLSTRV